MSLLPPSHLRYTVGTVAEQLYFKSGMDSELTRRFTDIFNVVLPMGVLGIPLFGWITERMGFQTCALVPKQTSRQLVASISRMPALLLRIHNIKFPSLHSVCLPRYRGDHSAGDRVRLGQPLP